MRAAHARGFSAARARVPISIILLLQKYSMLSPEKPARGNQGGWGLIQDGTGIPVCTYVVRSGESASTRASPELAEAEDARSKRE